MIMQSETCPKCGAPELNSVDGDSEDKRYVFCDQCDYAEEKAK